jgi:multidrug efflux pump subunit AcrA (membrane-fusion protein)
MPARNSDARHLNIDAHSYQVQDILGRAPNWILRWGITAIAACVAVLITLAWVIEYPDILEAPVSITGTTPAAPVVAQQDGHLEHLFVTENERVNRGAMLAVIKSPANAERVFKVKEDAEKLRPFLTDPDSLPEITLGDESQLGQLQTTYSELFSNYSLYHRTLADDYVESTVTTLEQQVERKKAQVANMRQQEATSAQELEIARKTYQSMKALNDRGSLSNTDLSKHEATMLENQRQHSAVEKSLLEEEIAASGFEKEIHDLQHKRELELRTARSTLRESIKKLISDIEIWENEYVLRAPVAGGVAFYEFWTDQQYVKKGDQVFIIAPDTSELLGKVKIKIKGAGKIEQGQTVRIRLNDFPAKEFGMVNGTVKSISQVAREGAYQVMVELDYPLTTTYKKELPFKQDMEGTASVVTARRSLLGRIFNELRKIFTDGV